MLNVVYIKMFSPDAMFSSSSFLKTRLLFQGIEVPKNVVIVAFQGSALLAKINRIYSA